MASYAWTFGTQRLTAQVNLDNLFDRTYFTGSNSGSMIAVGRRAA